MANNIQDPELVLRIDDIYNVITEHLSHLDSLWPDAETHGPRKVMIVELIEAIKLKLCMIAEKNMTRYESPFDKAARKITGTQIKPKVSPPETKPPVTGDKTSMQLAHEAAQARIRSRPTS